MRCVDIQNLKAKIRINHQSDKKSLSPLSFSGIGQDILRLERPMQGDLNSIENISIFLEIRGEWREYSVESFGPQTAPESNTFEYIKFTLKEDKQSDFKRDLLLARC